MRQRRETPEPWAGAMERAEIRSLRHLSELTGVAVETLARLVHGEGTASDHTVEAVAAVLRRPDSRRVAEWAGKQWGGADPVLPDAARRLTPKQWQAVEAVIVAMAEPGAQSDAALRAEITEQLRSAYGLAASDPASGGDGELRRPKRPRSKGPTS